MTATDGATSHHLASLLASASVEVSSRGHQLQQLRDNFAQGTDVTITFLPGDNYRHNVETAAALRRAGYNPVPHIAARELASREALDDFLLRARGEADVGRVVLIAGDVAAARGPFKSSLDVCASGLIEARGIARVSVAGHPEGHPFLDPAASFKVLQAWRDWGRQTRAQVDVVTQFCFESGPIQAWIGELNARGIDLPVIVGLAGPATPATLTKFALRCGIGNSMRALRSQIGRFGRLLTDTGADDVMRGLQSAPKTATVSIAGFHLFPFGGLRKSGDWLRNYEKETLPQMERRFRFAFFFALLHLFFLLATALVATFDPSVMGGARVGAALTASLAAVTLGSIVLFEGIVRRVRPGLPRIVPDVVTTLAAMVGLVRASSQLGFEVTGVIATSAVLTAVVGLSLQDTLGNVLGGARPAAGLVRASRRLGATSAMVGRVTEIRWRYTAIETDDWETVRSCQQHADGARRCVIRAAQGQPVQWRRWVYFQVDFRGPRPAT